MQKFLLFFFFIFSLKLNSGVIEHLRKLEDKTEVKSIPGIDYIYLINLDHRKEKYQQSMEQFAPWGIMPYRLSAVNGWKLPYDTVIDVLLSFKKNMRGGGMGTVYRQANGKEYHSHEIVEVEGTHYVCHCMTRSAVGCILSHLTAMKDALDSGYEVVWICEDDIEVMRDPHILSKYIQDLDDIEGRDNWDLFFTFRDYRGHGGKYWTPHGAAYRPNIDTRNQKKFNINRPISDDLREVGTRFGTQSMIWTRKGMKKALNHYEKYKIFLPYDLDICLIPGIKIYSVINDVVTNKLDSLSDLGNSSQ